MGVARSWPLICLIALTAPPAGAAAFVYLEQERTVTAVVEASAARIADGDSLFDGAFDFSPFDATVMGSAAVSGASADADGRQDSLLLCNRIWASGDAGAAIAGDAADAAASGFGDSLLEIVFRVSVSGLYRLEGELAVSGDAAADAVAAVELEEDGGALLAAFVAGFDSGGAPDPALPFGVDVLLREGTTYRLLALATALAPFDPFALFVPAGAGAAFEVHLVPEPSRAGLLALLVLALVCLRRAPS